MTQARGGRLQIGITAAMRSDQDDEVEVGGALGKPGEISAEKLPPLEIVRQIDNPVIETVRRLWWRAIDRVCGFFVLIRLSIHDRIDGPEPPTPADLQRDADQERLARTLPLVGETIEPRKHRVEHKNGNVGSRYQFR